jgi:hypothetical protein
LKLSEAEQKDETTTRWYRVADAGELKEGEVRAQPFDLNRILSTLRMMHNPLIASDVLLSRLTG